MKDEGRTHRLRLSPKALCFIVGVLMLIPIGLATSVWLNIHLYNERSVIVENQIMLQYQVDKNAQTIARLGNLEGFLITHSPGLLGRLVSQHVDTMLVPAIGSEDEQLANELKKLAINNTNTTTISKHPIELDAKSTIANKEEIAKPPLKGENAITALPITEVKNKTDLTQKEKQELTPIPDIKQSINLGYVKLQYVLVNLIKDNINIQYYLRNTGKDVPLLGDQKYTLINIKNGKIEKTPLVNVTNDNFRIRSLKIVESTVQLSGIEIDALARIQIDIVRNGTVLFRETYPIVR